MSHPSVHARTDPAKPALIVAETGQVVTYAELEAGSNRAAHLFRTHGLAPGDTIALCLENRPDFFDLLWRAQRAGLVFVCLSTRLTASELDYIVRDSGARLVVASGGLAPVVEGLAKGLPRFLLRDRYWAEADVRSEEA